MIIKIIQNALPESLHVKNRLKVTGKMYYKTIRRIP